MAVPCLGNDDASLLLKQIAGNDPAAQRSAAKKLYTLQNKATLSHLIRALKDDDWRVRGVAAANLGRFHDPRVPALLKKALYDPGEFVRIGAVTGIIQLPRAQAMPLLIPVLKDRCLMVRRLAVKSLDDLHWKPSSDEERMIYTIASLDIKGLVTLVKIGDPRAVEPLLKALEDSDSKVREAAASAMTKLIQQAGMRKDSEDVDWLVQMLQCSYPSFRKSAAKALSNFVDPQSVGMVVLTLNSFYRLRDWFNVNHYLLIFALCLWLVIFRSKSMALSIIFLLSIYFLTFYLYAIIYDLNE